jgi:hypothetical protein
MFVDFARFGKESPSAIPPGATSRMAGNLAYHVHPVVDS